MDGEKLEIKKHVKYFQRCLQVLPARYASLDSNRMTIAFFALSGLDLLGGLDCESVDKSNIVDWIYSLQILPMEAKDESEESDDMNHCGFRGGTWNGFRSSDSAGDVLYDSGHVAMTYTALCCLLVLGDDLSRVNRKAIVSGLSSLQLPDGSFQFCAEGSERDMRFIFCVASICYIIDDCSAIDLDKAVEYIMSSLTYEGAFAQGPNLEAHGGSTFCAVAALWLFKRLDVMTVRQTQLLQHWCHMRQQSAFQGRPNKPVDTCYSFWVGGTLHLLDSFDKVNEAANRCFLYSTQDYITGGFSKWESSAPDPLHSYMGLSGLAMMNEPGVLGLFPALNISQRAADHLHDLHSAWRRIVAH